MTYMEYVRSYLEKKEQGIPIYTEEIAEAMAAFFASKRKKLLQRLPLLSSGSWIDAGFRICGFIIGR